MPEQRHPTRRNLARGALWSVPVAVAATAAPAFAASGCTPNLRFEGGLYYNYGVIDSRTGTTNQYLTVGGETYVDNLPTGVTVTAITYVFWLENRQGQTSSGPGIFWMGNGTSSTRSSCSASGCTVSWNPTGGSGFSTTVTNTVNNQSHTFQNGTTAPAWDIQMTWSRATAPGTYTAGTGTCRNFDTGPSGRFRVDYTGVTALTTADVASNKKRILSDAVITATLSDGTVLRKSYPVEYRG